MAATSSHDDISNAEEQLPQIFRENKWRKIAFKEGCFCFL